MKKVISFLLTAALAAGITALPCSAEGPAQTQAPKQDDLDDMVLTEPVGGGPLVEYEGEGYKIEFDTGETKAPFLSSDKKAIIKIVSTVKPGHMSKDEEKMFTEMAEKNGEPDLMSARIYPIYFDGHIKLDRNIRVNVDIPVGALDGGYDLNFYHIKDDGTIEYLKDAELETANYPDGYISRIKFKTNEFSTFFTAKKDLDLSDYLDKSSAEELKAEMTSTTVTTAADTANTSTSDTTADNKPLDGDFTPMAVVFAAAGGGMLLGILATVVIMKKKTGK